MTKQEAHKEMLKGHKMRHQYYSPEEFVFINSDNEFETEDGYSHGGIYDEFWQVYQKWEDGWDYYDVTSKVDITEFGKCASSYLLSNTDKIYELTSIRNAPELFYGSASKQQRIDAERIKPVKPKSVINRNDLCDCGSGVKFKKCCGK